MKYNDLRTELEQLKGVKYHIEQEKIQLVEKLRSKNKRIKHLEKAREIIRKVSLKTQQQLSFHISDITSLAMNTVFDNPYKLAVNFVERRNKTECDLLFERNESQINPIDSSGLGAVDVAAFSLRIASLTMQNPKLRSVLIQDEPFKHLKGITENIKVIEMVKQISKRLGIQIIMVHDERVPLEEIERGADKIFKVDLIKEISRITES
jgi:hypothetical protein